MIKYELKRNEREVKYKDRKEIEPGCTLAQADQEPEVIKEFTDKEEALEALKDYQSEVVKYEGVCGSIYKVTEYYVEENEYDEDGEFVEGGDVWDYSTMDFDPTDE